MKSKIRSKLNIDEIIKLIKQGLNYSQIGRKVGANHKTVKNFILKNNIEYNNPNPPTKDFHNQIVKLANDGLYAAEIAKKLNLKKDVVTTYIRKNKIKIKDGRKDKTPDLTGMTFDKLYVEELAYKNEKYQKYYRCSCICGGEKIARGTHLLSGNIRSCGCLAGQNMISDSEEKGVERRSITNKYIGQKFNRLTVVDIIYDHSDYKKGGKVIFKCKCLCECGNIGYVRVHKLKNNSTKSCGCYIREQMAKNSSKAKWYNYDWYFIKNDTKISCRSSYEVFFANCLILNKINFKYEPKTFRLENGSYYTPDFYLEDEDLWIELKGVDDNEKQKTSRKLFSKNHNLKLMFWEDIVESCNLPFKSTSTYFNRADRKNMSREDYLAKMLYIGTKPHMGRKCS